MFFEERRNNFAALLRREIKELMHIVYIHVDTLLSPDQMNSLEVSSNKVYILSTAIAYLCVIDAKHYLNDPHSDKNAIMSMFRNDFLEFPSFSRDRT